MSPNAPHRRLALLVALAALAAAPLAAADAPAAGRWRAQDGGFLPFLTADEAVDFLRTAEVVDRKVIQGTYNNPLRLTLARDGVTARAIFRTVDIAAMSLNQRVDHRLMLRDHYKYEVAAYELSRLLGLDNVPPTALRTIDGREGSIQLWIEAAETEEKRLIEGRAAAHPQLVALQQQELHVFDMLILNWDRNAGNQLVDQDGKLWYVDHTRTFMRMPDLAGVEQLRFCDRRLWDGLRALDRDTAKAALAPYLEPAQIDALLKRHRMLVRKLEDMIAKQGEENVLFEIRRG